MKYKTILFCSLLAFCGCQVSFPQKGNNQRSGYNQRGSYQSYPQSGNSYYYDQGSSPQSGDYYNTDQGSSYYYDQSYPQSGYDNNSSDPSNGYYSDDSGSDYGVVGAKMFRNQRGPRVQNRRY